MSKKKMDVNRKYSIKKLSLGVASVSVGLVVANAIDLDTMITGENPGESKSVAHAAVGDVLYTNAKPTDKVDAQGTNNDAISKIVEMKSDVEGQKKIRVYFGDNLKLNNKISFETFGNIRNGIDSDKIKFNNEKVGSLSVYYNSRDKNLYNYSNFKSFNEYYNYITQDKSPTEKSKIEITLNDNFKKYNKNRYIEFEVKAEDLSHGISYTKESPDTKKLNGYKKTIKNEIILPNGNKTTLKDTYYVFSVVERINKKVEFEPLSLESYTFSTSKGLPGYLKEAKGIYGYSTFTQYDKRKDSNKIVLEKGSKIENILNDKNIYKIKDSLKVGDIVEFDTRSTTNKSDYNLIWTDSVFEELKQQGSNEEVNEKAKFKIVEKTDTKIVYESLNDITKKGVLNSIIKTIDDKTIREDFINKIGKENLTSFLSKKDRELKTEGTNQIIVKDKNNKKIFVSRIEELTLIKNADNLGYGESTTGSVQVKYVDENNKEIRKSELVAHNEKWNKDINITPPSIEGYAYVSSSSPLKDIVGGEDRTIVLKYKNVEIKKTRELPFNVIYKEDKSLERGKTVVESQGEKGVEEYKTLAGKEVANSKKITKQPVNRVVKIGAKDKVETEKTPFITRYEADNTKEKGTQTVVSPGREGVKTTITTFSVDPQSGAVKENKGKPTLKLPEERVVKVGAKDKVVTEKLPFTTRFEADNTKEKGTQTVVSPGKEGTKTTVTKYTVNPSTGAVTESVQKPTVVAAQDKVIKVGAKDKVDPKIIPSVKKYVKDETREYGQPNITVSGTPGVEKITTKYTVNPNTGAITETKGKPEITQSTDTIIKVAAKTKVEIKKTLPKIEIRENKEMVKGKEKIVQQGKPRVLKETTEYVVNPNTGEITQAKRTDVVEAGQPTIKEVGIRDSKNIYKDKETTVVISHDDLKNYTSANEDSAEITSEGDKEYKLTKIETEYQGDPTLEKGKQVEVSNGKKDGKRIVKVGTKSVVTKSNIPFIEKKEFSDKLAKGQEKVKQEGKVGTRTTTISYMVNPKTGEITEERGTPLIVEPQGKRILVPAKDKVEVVNKDGKVIKRTTVYNVDSNTGKITEDIREEVIADKGDAATEESLTELKVDLQKDTEGNILNVIKMGEEPKDLDGYINTGKTELTKEGYKVYIYQKVETSKGEELPPVVENKDFEGGINPDNALVVGSQPELKVAVIKDTEGNILDVVEENGKPVEIKDYIYTGKQEIDENGYKVYIYQKVENSKGTENPPVVENLPEFTGGVKPTDDPVAEELPELKVAVIKDNKDNILDVIKADEEPKEIKGYKNTGKTGVDKDGYKVYVYEKVEESKETPTTKENKVEDVNKEKVNKENNDKEITKKDELPSTTAIPMLSTVSLLSVLGVRKRKNKK